MILFRTAFIASLVFYAQTSFSAHELGTAQLNITGNLVIKSCKVIDESQKQDIFLGDRSTATFTGVGSTSPSIPFSIQLTDCLENTTGAKILFSGNTDGVQPALLALTESANAAKGFAIELLNDADQTIAINQQTDQYTLKEGDNTFNFKLRYKQTLADFTAGDASSVMYFDIIYQ